MHMVMTNFLQERKSVREYKGQSLSAKDMERVKNAVDKANTDYKAAQLSFHLYENGTIVAEKLQGKAGYGGVMVEAPHYVSMTIASKEEKDLLKAGYALESLNTDLVHMDLGTCWITVDNVEAELKKEVFGQDGENIDFLIALGYPKGKKLFEAESHSARMELKDFVFKDNFSTPLSLDDMENYGLLDVFSSVRYAPSHKNAQPWRFVLKDNKVNLYLVTGKEDSRSYIDLGIMMFYFKEMMKTMGADHEWQEEEGERVENCQLIASYSL